MVAMALASNEQQIDAVNHLVAAQLTKTKMCGMFVRGACRDTNCRFAHTSAELRSAPDLTKTAMCRAFARGNCQDTKCKFAHGEHELRVTETVYKTQLCNFYEQRGRCKKGAECRHAHGIAELRQAQSDEVSSAASTSGSVDSIPSTPASSSSSSVSSPSPSGTPPRQRQHEREPLRLAPPTRKSASRTTEMVQNDAMTARSTTLGAAADTMQSSRSSFEFVRDTFPMKVCLPSYTTTKDFTDSSSSVTTGGAPPLCPPPYAHEAQPAAAHMVPAMPSFESRPAWEGASPELLRAAWIAVAAARQADSLAAMVAASLAAADAPASSAPCHVRGSDIFADDSKWLL